MTSIAVALAPLITSVHDDSSLCSLPPLVTPTLTPTPSIISFPIWMSISTPSDASSSAAAISHILYSTPPVSCSMVYFTLLLCLSSLFPAAFLFMLRITLTLSLCRILWFFIFFFVPSFSCPSSLLLRSNLVTSTLLIIVSSPSYVYVLPYYFLSVTLRL